MKRVIRASSEIKERFWLDYGPRSGYQRKLFYSQEELEDFAKDLIAADTYNTQLRAFKETEISLAPFVKMMKLDDPDLPRAVASRLRHGEVLTQEEYDKYSE